MDLMKREDKFDEEQRDWRNLPSDILFEIYQHIDDDKTDNEFELRRMRSVCTSWRSSLLPLKKPLQFPLKLPPPPSLLNKTYDSNKPFTTSYLSRSNIILFPPPPGLGHQESVWIVKVEQRVELSKLRLQNPLFFMSASFKDPTLRKGSFDMFDCNVSEITRSYSLKYGKSIETYPRKAKAVVCWNTNPKDSKNGDFTVLVLFKERKLGLWRPGEAEWSIIPDPVFENDQFVIKNTHFSDIISFEGKFYATTKEARLIMIDPTTYKVRNLITVGLDLGYVFLMSYLVESNKRLYLIYKDHFLSCDPDEHGYVSVFMLEAHTGINKNQTCTWNVVTNLEDRVFFATDYVTFSITAEGLGWSKGNYVILPFHPFGPQRIHLFFSVDENLIDDDDDNLLYFADYLGFYSLQDLKMYSGMKEVAQFTKIFWPPPDWLLSKN